MDDPLEEKESSFTEFSSFSCSVLPIDESNLSNKSSCDSWEADFRGFEEAFPAHTIVDNTPPRQINSSVKENTEIKSKDFITCNFSAFRQIFSIKDNCLREGRNLEERCTETTLLDNLKTIHHDPVNAKETLFYQMKVDTVSKLLNQSQFRETWIQSVESLSLGIDRPKLDYHNLIKKSNPKAGFIYENQKDVEKYIGNSEINDHNTAIEPIINEEQECNLAKLRNNQEDNHKELFDKPVAELKEIVFELELQAKIYSELLLSELSYRDKLNRDKELKNVFISSNVAVERKLADEEKKKKKNRYTFFKYADEESKITGVTIPYIHREGGPTSSDLVLMIEILKSLVNGEERTPKLISDYVMKLGDQNDLQTIIKIRTANGLHTVNDVSSDQT